MVSPATTHQATETSSSTGHMDGLSDDLVAEIMFRLPSTCVLSCRAVCRAWRRITTSPAFLAADARRRPMELVLRAPGALYTVPLANLDDETTKKRCLLPLRCPEYAAFKDPPASAPFEDCLGLLGSCDGLLMFERGCYGFTFLVCNPVSRQWLMLPRPAGMTRPCGLYVHRPSGEHRLLYLANDADETAAARRTASHYVLPLGASQARRLGLAATTAVEFYTLIPEAYLSYRGNLHWLRHPDVYDTDKILAFNTASETFRHISRPPLADPYNEHPFLLETDGVLTVASILCDGSKDMDLWALQDYNDDTSWTRRLRVSMPSPASWVMNAGVLGQNVILLKESSVVVLYDLAEKKVLKQIDLANCTNNTVATRPTTFVFQDRVERHAFFAQQDLN